MIAISDMGMLHLHRRKWQRNHRTRMRLPVNLAWNAYRNS